MLYILFILFFQTLFGADLPPSTPIEIPMSDGCILKADVYSPVPEAKNLPIILIRSPSGRQNPFALQYLPLLKEGFAIVIQDTRSAKDLEGATLPYRSDGWTEHRDGYDTVAYLSKSPISNGSVGTVGPSAMGITQLMMAPTGPPGLKAQYVAFATSDLFNHGLYQSGDLYKHQVEEWLKMYAKHPSVYKQIYTQYEYNDFWAEMNMLPHASQCKSPILHLGGWYDVFLKGTVEAYAHIQKNGGEGAKGTQRLVIGPWIHLWPFVKNFGEYEYPQAALNPPYDFTPAKWFNHHIKGEQNGVEKLPQVVYYVMGPVDGTTSSGNVWKSAKEWPIPSETTSFYLTAEKTLNSNAKDNGTLSFNYDPENPIPTLGGRNLFLPAGPFDQRPIEKREDTLVFTTDPLEKDLEITGDVKAVLFVGTDKEDTSFSVRLTDVYPDGRSLLIADGMARLSYFKKKAQPAEIEVDLLPTSIVIAKGHRIRIIVSSSNYPRYEKNLNSLARPYQNPKPSIAKNTIYMGTTTPSRLLLPIVNNVAVK